MEMHGVDWSVYPFNDIRRTVHELYGVPPGSRNPTVVSDLIGAVSDLFPALYPEVRGD